MNLFVLGVDFRFQFIDNFFANIKFIAQVGHSILLIHNLNFPFALGPSDLLFFISNCISQISDMHFETFDLSAVILGNFLKFIEAIIFAF